MRADEFRCEDCGCRMDLHGLRVYRGAGEAGLCVACVAHYADAASATRQMERVIERRASAHRIIRAAEKGGCDAHAA